MDRSITFKLISESFTSDAIGQQIATETSRTVYGNLASIGQNEFFAAGQQGIRAELKITMFEPDYKGEEIAEIELYGKPQRFEIYRTYRGKGEVLELYLGRRVGV